MPDITMCSNHSCPLKQDCYRHEARPNEFWQAMAKFEPDSPTHCRYQMTINGKKVEKKGS